MKRWIVPVLLFLSGCGGPVGKDQSLVLHRRLEGEPQTLNASLLSVPKRWSWPRRGWKR